MKRDLMVSLEKWAQSPRRKPLLLQGARQVGKTWLLREFGRQAFQNTAYINLETRPEACDLFNAGYDIPHLLQNLQILTGQLILPGQTLLIFDEAQACPKALTSLKYFCEDMPELAVAAAGSLPGLAAQEGSGFPVGPVNMRSLHPLTFWEFLEAVDAGPLRDVLESGDPSRFQMFTKVLTAHLRDYYFVGGMPEAVAAFAASHDYDAVREIQNEILNGYRLALCRSFGGRKLGPVLALFEAIPAQLNKENRRLVFGEVRKGARGRDFLDALTWLEQAGIAHVVQRIEKPALPLTSYVASKQKAFKLFLVDVGLLGAMAGVPARTLLEGSRIFVEFKGALTEQYVCQQLISGCSLQPFYWSRPKGAAEVDFVVQQNAAVYGLEVKAAENVQAKSLRTFHTMYPETHAVRFSLSDYRPQDWTVNVPLYAVQNEALWHLPPHDPVPV